MPKIQFKVKLEAIKGGVIFTLPKRESVKFEVRGRVPIVGTINGYRFRSSIFPTGDGTHYIAVNKEMREGAGIAAGERVEVTMEVDTAPRTVAIPADLTAALSKSTAAKVRFDKLSYTHRKEYAQWLESAKRPETRTRRLKQIIDKLTAE